MTRVLLEDDKSLRLVQVILDPAAPRERATAFADYLAHDVPDLEAWCASMRSRIAPLYPASTHMAATQEELRAKLPGAQVAVFKSSSFIPRPARKLSRARAMRSRNRGSFSNR